MKSRKHFVLSSLLLALLGLFLLVQTLPAHSYGNPAADLVLHKAVAPLTALEPGDEIQYTLTFSNAGVLTATEVLISDTLPSLLTGVTVASNLPITSTGQAWLVGTLPPDAGGIITLTGQISPALTSELTFTNTATITSPITDTQPANNTSAVMSEVNLPPMVDAGPEASALVGQPFTLTASFTEPGLDDTHTAVIVWGDGLTGTAALSETAQTLTAMHVYTATGAFTVTVGVVDSDGGQDSDGLVITVEEVTNNLYFLYLPIQLNFFNPLNNPEVSPSPNSIDAPSNTPISAIYGVGIHMGDDPDINQHFVIHSQQIGVVTGTYGYGIDGVLSTLTLWPAQPLPAGDTVQATLTTQIVGMVGITALHPDVPRVWQFQIAPSGGSGYMLPANVPTFGGGNSTDLAWGDVDGDGDGDVLVTNEDQPATVWLNDGQGAFTPHPTTPELGAGGEQAIALGDLDNDRDVDAVLATFGAETVWVNDGLGNFTPHPTAPTFGEGTSLDIALGDLNGDGFLDALVANTNGEPETVWLNDGTGAFLPHPTMPTFGAEDSTSVALGDVDGDFDLDAVVANTNGKPETVWLNDTTGQFTPHETMPAFGAGNSQAVQLGDLDGDGHLDAVVANSLGEAETVWRNDGTGQFLSDFFPDSFGTGDSTDLALGDLDGDRDFDVVVANANGEPETVWLNDGTGSFSEHPGNPMFGEGDSQGVVLGDLDGDGDLDVIVANIGGETVWMGKEMKVVASVPAGNGAMIAQNQTFLVTFDHPVNASTVNTDTFLVRGDFTGKYSGTFSFPAQNQILFTSSRPYLPGEQVRITLGRFIFSEDGLPLQPFTWQVLVLSSNGTGGLSFSASFGYGFGDDIAFGDLDGDQDLDIVVALFNPIFGGDGASIWLNDGTGNYIPHPTTSVLSGFIAPGVALGDLDGDGDLDAVFAGSPYSTVYLNDGAGGFYSHPTFPNFGYGNLGADVQFADLDGDGDLDVVLTTSSLWGEHSVGQVWLNDGVGQFYLQPSLSTFEINTSGINLSTSLADLDQDGNLDFISPAIWVKNLGNGIFVPEANPFDFSALGYLYPTNTVGDVDGDGDLDLVFADKNFNSQESAPASVWLNDGEGHFSPHPTTPTFGGGTTEGIALCDLDSDGDLDAIFANNGEPSTIWVNDGLGNFSLHPTSPSFGPEMGISVLCGDLDGDGDMDIVLTGGTITYPQPEPAIWIYQNQ